MNATQAIGLGEPQISGKRSLFQPPKPMVDKKPDPKKASKPAKAKPKVERVHVTMDLTLKALTILENIQRQHRMKTGKVLPLWKAASKVIEASEKNKSSR